MTSPLTATSSHYSKMAVGGPIVRMQSSNIHNIKWEAVWFVIFTYNKKSNRPQGILKKPFGRIKLLVKL